MSHLYGQTALLQSSIPGRGTLLNPLSETQKNVQCWHGSVSIGQKRTHRYITCYLAMLFPSGISKPVLCPIFDVKLPYLVNADLFFDIFSTVLGLSSVNNFNCDCFLRISVHQQPDPGTKAHRVEDGKQYNLDTANLNIHTSSLAGGDEMCFKQN